MADDWILKVSKVPDWGRRAIRLSLSLIVFTTLGLTLWIVPYQYRAEWGDEVVQSCNWAGATCAVVAASPLIGKVAQLSYERTLGTVSGGLLGFLVYDYVVRLLPPAAGNVVMVVCAAAVGALSCWLSNKFKLDASMRLFVITFLIVTFGAHNKEGDDSSALGVALLRTGGILAGVVVFMILTVAVLPKSATIEALREMKNGLKLVTELNTLVWTSKQEAAAVLQKAVADARAAEAAAATAATQAVSAVPAPAANITPSEAVNSNKADPALSSSSPFFTRWFSGRTRADGYVPLPSEEAEAAEAGMAGPQQVRIPATPAVAAPAAPGAVSGLTRALKNSSSTLATPQHQCTAPLTTSILNAPLGATDRAGTAAVAASNQQQQQQQQQHDAEYDGHEQDRVLRDASQISAYQEVLDHYEVRCEAVLTSVYQSMFKVKDHIALAESEVYVHHAWGHYLFLPVLFGKAFVNCVRPHRWRLPVKAMEEMSTSIRVLARLLWTVHLDYSQGFDEVLTALPAGSDMTNLLQELAQVISASLGVLVEAFPNKTAILVSHLEQLDSLVDRMLEIGESHHEAILQELAASRYTLHNRMRPSEPAATPHQVPMLMAAGASPTAAAAARLSMQLDKQQHQQQQQQQPPRLSALASLPPAPFSQVIRRAVSMKDGRHWGGPLTAAAARGSGGGGGSGDLREALSVQLLRQQHAAGDASPIVGTAPPYEAAGWQHHLQQRQQQQEPGQHHVPVAPSTRNITFVTFANSSSDQQQQQRGSGLVQESSEYEGVGRPIPTQSPVLGTSPAAAGAFISGSSSMAAHHVPGSATQHSGLHKTATTAASPQADLIFMLDDQQQQQTHQQLQQQQQLQGSTGSPGGIFPAPASCQAMLKSRLRPFAVLAAVKLQRAGHEGCQTCNAPVAAGGAPGTPVGEAASAATAEALRTCLSTVSAPDASEVDAALALLQQQQHLPADAAAKAVGAAAASVAAAGSGGSEGGGVRDAVGGSNDATAAEDEKISNYVRLTRWYSFQFLIMELEEELGRLYEAVSKTLALLPHGL